MMPETTDILTIKLKPAPRRQRMTVVVQAHFTNPDDAPVSKRAAFEYERVLADDAVSDSAARKRLAVPSEFAVVLEPPSASVFALIENTGSSWVRVQSTPMGIPPKATIMMALSGAIYVKADDSGSQISIEWLPL
jgi:hypothetical protein